MALDTLQARSRYLALFDRYGALLTDHQREVLDLHLRSDWSLAEIAGHQGTSRAAVHDIVRRSTRSLFVPTAGGVSGSSFHRRTRRQLRSDTA